MKTRSTVAALALAGVLLAFGGTARLQAGVVSYVKLNPLTADADSGISTSDFYTHLLDFGAGAVATVNGVPFTQVTVANIDGIPDFTHAISSGTRNETAGNETGVDATQAIQQLMLDFVYNGGTVPGGTATMALSGLIPGYEYETRIYSRRWTASQNRQASFDFDTDGDGVAEDTIPLLNQDDARWDPPSDGTYLDTTAYAISYQFTADSDTETITITHPINTYSWHLYGLTNEEFGVTDLNWTGAEGAAWNSSNWSGTGGDFPDGHTNTTVDNGTTVVVTAPAEARTLTVGSGGVTINGTRSLSVMREVIFADGTTLAMNAGATLAALGGNIPAISPPGDTTFNVTSGILIGGGYDDTLPASTARVLTKQGEGTFALDNSNGTDVQAAQTTIKVEAGTLRMTGADPLGGATSVELAGGTLAVFDLSPTAYYSYDDSGAAGEDDSGFGHTGSLLEGAAWTDTDKKFGAGALSLVGDNARMMVAPMVDLGDSWTIATWYKGLRSTGWQTLTRGTPVATGDHQIIVDTAGNLGTFASTGGGFQDSGYDMYGLDNGIWHHIAAVGSGGATDLYIDGDYVGTSAYQSTTNVTAIGNYPTGTQRFSDLLDETIVFNRPLSADDINSMYTFGTVSFGDSLSLAGKSILVTADSTLQATSPTAVPVGPLTMKAGSLTTSGSTPGMTFTDTTIHQDAEAVGFDPQVPTEYGTITNLSTQPTVTVSKTGPSTWVLDTPLAGDTSNVQWDVEDGTLRLRGTDTLDGQPIVVTGGVFEVIGETGISDAPVELTGGMFQVRGTGGAAQSAPANPIAYYAFDSVSDGTTPNDGTGGSVLNGALVGDATLTSGDGGLMGEAMQFSGAGLVQVPYDAFLGLNEFTVSAWVNMDSEPPGWPPGPEYGIMGTRIGGDNTFDLKVGQTRIHGDVGDGAAWINTYIDINQGHTGDTGQGGDLQVGQWHLVTYVVDDTDKQFELYVDGDLKRIIPFAADLTPLLMQEGQSLWIGNDSGSGNGEPMNGLIDEVYIYDRALTATDVDTLWGDGFGPNDGSGGLSMANTDLLVTGPSTLVAVHPAAGGGPTPFGDLTIADGGQLTTSGNMAGISFNSTTIDENATAVGFDPLVPTSYGGINASGAPVTISKVGPSTWLLDPAPTGMTHVDSAWQVEDGVLKVSGTAPLAGRPVTVTGGILELDDAAPLDASVTLAGGTMVVRSTGTVVVDDALEEWWFDAVPQLLHSEDRDHRLDTIDSSIGLLTMAPDSTNVLDVPLAFPSATEMNARAGGTVGTDNIAAVWHGQITIGTEGSGLPLEAGEVTFGTNSDEGSVVWIDVNQDGDFLDPGELIADNNGSHGPQIWGGHVDLAAGSYGIAIGYFEGTSTEEVEVRFIAGWADPQSQAEVDALWGTMTTIDPSDTENQGGLWSATRLLALDAGDVDVAVTDDSRLVPMTDFTADFGSLTMHGGVLTTTGAPGGITFSGTTIDPLGDAPFTVGLNVKVPTQLGEIDVLNTVDPTTFVKRGNADLVLTDANLGIGAYYDNMTFDVQEGALVGVHGSNPFGVATLQLAGGELVLTAGAASPPVAGFDNPLSVTQDSTITAGSDSVGAAGVEAVLAPAMGGINLDGYQLSLRSVNNSTLNIAGELGGDGTVLATEGNVVISGGGSLTSLEVAGADLEVAEIDLVADSVVVGEGRLHLAMANLVATTADVSEGAVVSTDSASHLTVAQRLSLDQIDFSLEGAESFWASGADLLSEGAITLKGGTVTVNAGGAPAGAVAHYSFDEGSEGNPSAQDSAGSNHGTVVNAAWAVGQVGAGSLGFNPAQGSHVEVPYDVSLDLSEYSISLWFNAATDPAAGDWLGLLGTRNNGANENFDLKIMPDYIHGDIGEGGGVSWINIDVDIRAVDGGDTNRGEWHMVTYVIDNTNKRYDLYLDGDLKRTMPFLDAGKTPRFMTPGTVMQIGNDYQDVATPPGGQHWMDGTMDDVFIYGRALSEGEVARLFGTGTGPLASGLELYDHDLIADTTSELYVDSSTDANFGDVTLFDGVELTLSGAPAFNLEGLNAGDGSRLVAAGGTLGFYFRGLLNPGTIGGKANGLGTTTVVAFVEMDMEDGGYAADVGGSSNDLVVIENGDIEVAGRLTVEATASLDAVKDQVLTIMQGPGGEFGIYGEFFPVPKVGDFSLPATDPDRYGDYLGYGVWFGNDKTGEGARYVGRTYDPPEAYDPDVPATAVTVSVFQAKPGDCNGDRSISFADFNDLANNYTGALGPGAGGKEWRHGDFNGDADVDFGDFNDLANNYTGAGVEYGPGGPASGAKAAAGEALLIVYLANATDANGVSHSAGDVVLSVEGGQDAPGMRINGYEVYSAAGLLVPDAGGAPYPLVGGAYMEESAAAIVAFGGLTSPLAVSGEADWTLGWKVDVQPKAAGDLEFSYGTSGGVISGNVLYVVPEPGTLLLLACGALGLLLWWRRRVM